jgi:hypothetical protein
MPPDSGLVGISSRPVRRVLRPKAAVPCRPITARPASWLARDLVIAEACWSGPVAAHGASFEVVGPVWVGAFRSSRCARSSPPRSLGWRGPRGVRSSRCAWSPPFGVVGLAGAGGGQVQSLRMVASFGVAGLVGAGAGQVQSLRMVASCHVVGLVNGGSVRSSRCAR